jgi:hypothetical protein
MLDSLPHETSAAAQFAPSRAQSRETEPNDSADVPSRSHLSARERPAPLSHPDELNTASQTPWLLLWTL